MKIKVEKEDILKLNGALNRVLDNIEGELSDFEGVDTETGEAWREIEEVMNKINKELGKVHK
jgi:uncharacterized protein Yka (UPF0111/DUF47 family)